MRLFTIARTLLIAITLPLLNPVLLPAQTWEGDIVETGFLNPFAGSYLWTNVGNWTTGQPPNSAQTATFSSITAGNSSVVTLYGALNAGAVNFTSTAASFSLQTFPGADPTSLTLNGTAGPGPAIISNASGNAQTIDVNIIFAGTSGRTITNSGTGSIAFSRSVTSSTTNPALLTITNSGTGTGGISFSGSVTSSAGLTINSTNSTGFVNFGSASVAGSPILISGGGSTAFTGTLDNTSGSLSITKSDSGTLTTNLVSSAAGVAISNNGSGTTTIGSISNSSGNVSVSNTGTAAVNVGGITGGGSFQVTNSNSTGVVRLTGNVSATSVAFSGGGRVEVASGVTVSGEATVSGTGSTLSGLGSFGNAVTVENGATLSPGVGNVGNLAFNSGLTLGNSSTFSWDLTNETTGFDTVTVNGALSIASGINGAKSVLNISGVSDGFWNQNQSWNVFTGNFAAPTSVFSNIELAGAAPDASRGFFSWSSNAGNVSLNFTAVPEPSSMALLAVAGLVGGAYARRRQKLAKTAAC